MLSFLTLTFKCDLDLCQTLLKYDFCTSSRQGEYLIQFSKKSFKGLRRYVADTKSQRTFRRTDGQRARHNTTGLRLAYNQGFDVAYVSAHSYQF